jgi:hypothetical protein
MVFPIVDHKIQQKIFKWPHSISVIIFPLKRTWPLICTFRITLPKDDLY